jgi:hypothetical protein
MSHAVPSLPVVAPAEKSPAASVIAASATPAPN